jgi:hypothetical protein
MNVKYILKQIDEDNMSEVSSEFYGDGLDGICKYLTKFLKGCGFDFEGNISIVINDTDYFDDWPDVGSDNAMFDDEEEIADLSETCSICKLTRSHSDNHVCFHKTCPFESND